MRVLIFSFVLSSCYCLLTPISARWWTAGAMGLLLCNDKPAARVFMVLYHRGSFKTKLSATSTDKNGFFKISGTIRDFFSMRPQLRIHTWCNRKRDRSNMKDVCIDIPPKYIREGKKVWEYWNVDIEIGTEANLCSHPSAQ